MTQQKPDKNKSKRVFVDCNGIGNPKGRLIENREQELKDICSKHEHQYDNGYFCPDCRELKGIQEERERICRRLMLRFTSNITVISKRQFLDELRKINEQGEK